VIAKKAKKKGKRYDARAQQEGRVIGGRATGRD
jgi:hypothetical protein